MGCDIHLHQEVKIKGVWHHYRDTRTPRHYGLFSKMAGVRGDETPIAKARGLPQDVTEFTKFCSDYDGDDGHTHSYLTLDEIVILEKWLEERLGDKSWRIEIDYWGYLFGNSWGGFLTDPKSYPEELEDVRFVFWFDN